MAGVAKNLRRRALPWLWVAAYVSLLFWVLRGDRAHTLFSVMPKALVMPVLAIGAVVFILWVTVPRWRRVENQRHIQWTARLPFRIGLIAQAAIYLGVLPTFDTIQPWFQNDDYAHLICLPVLWGMSAAFAWASLRLALGNGVSLRVAADGLHFGGRRIVWSRIEAIESGFAELQGGAVVVLADRRFVLSPRRHGPTGRALVAAVERFSPETTIREPEFQAQFGGAGARGATS
jgi:hypothetical protein